MSKEDKSKKKPKRDPNKPLPKIKRAKRKILKLLVTGVVVVLLMWMGMFSAKVERAPWSWTGEDWSGFLTFSREQMDESKRMVEGELAKIDWSKFTEATKDLYEKVAVWETRVDTKLAELKEERESGEGGGGEAMSIASEPTAYELGLAQFRDAIAQYRDAVKNRDMGKLRAVKEEFHAADAKLEEAYEEADDADDQGAMQEIEEYRTECNRYIYDCNKLEVVDH